MKLIYMLYISYCFAAANVNTSKREETLEQCLDSAEVPFVVSDSTDWDEYDTSYNERLIYTPVAIAVPTTSDHIQAAVACGAEQGVKVTAKAGGHSYGSLGLGGEDGHLVIQLDHMDGVTLDTETNIATVEPGARLGHLALELFNQGNRAISHGTCPGVGVSGHVLHGGFGMSSHIHGLALDWVESMTVVLANASVVQCSQDENPDLFWAMLGAGSNFGIATSYQFKTFEPPKNTTYFSATLPWNQTSAVTVLEAIEDYARNDMPAELNMRIAVSSFSGSSIEGVYYGNKTELEDALEPLLNTTGGTLSTAKTTGWIETLEHYAYTDLNITYPYNAHETFYSKSLTLKGLNGTSASNFVDYLYETAKKVTRIWWLQIDIQGGSNAAIWEADPTKTSYAHRDKLYIVQLYDRSIGDYPDDGFDFLDGWVSTITEPLPQSDWGMYINYADPRLDRTTAQEVYWGENLPRLQKLKAQLDPEELFYYPISIEPAAAA